MTEYTDIREIHPEYITVPCRECDNEIWVRVGYTQHHDTAFCDEHSNLSTEDKYRLGVWKKPTVRL